MAATLLDTQSIFCLLSQILYIRYRDFGAIVVIHIPGQQRRMSRYAAVNDEKLSYSKAHKA